MKKLVVILASLVALAIVGVAIFLVTFDADRYRPLLVTQLESALGKPVHLERLSLGWRGGIAVELQGLAVYADTPMQGEPAATIERVSAVVRLLPLLRREVRVASLVVQRPTIRVRREPSGAVNVVGLAVVGRSPTGLRHSLGSAEGAASVGGPAAAASRQGSVGAAAVSLDISVVRIEDGVVIWTDEQISPPRALRVEALDLTLRNLSQTKPLDVDLRAVVAGGIMSASGTIDPSAGSPSAALQVRLENLELETLFAGSRPDEPRLVGRLSASFQGTGQGLAWPQISRTLTGQGRVKIQEARIERLNILREVFQRLSILPGLMESLQAKLPASYQAKLTARDTVLEPLDLAVTAQGGALSFPHLRLATESFQLEGAGRLGLDGVLICQSLLHVDPELSAAIIRSVAELRPLADAQGRLQLPVVIQGTLPRVAVMPDVQYVASRVVVTKAQELLGGLLERALERRDGASANAPSSSESPAPASSARQLLEQLIGKPSSR